MRPAFGRSNGKMMERCDELLEGLSGDALGPIGGGFVNQPPGFDRKGFFTAVHGDPMARAIAITEHLVKGRTILHERSRAGKAPFHHVPSGVWPGKTGFIGGTHLTAIR